MPSYTSKSHGTEPDTESATKKYPDRVHMSVHIGLRDRYGIDLMSRKYRRSSRASLEWIVARAVEEEFGEMMKKLYHDDKITRIKLLKKHLPELLSYEEKELLRKEGLL